MAEIAKPSDLSLIWASAGDILNPGDTKYQTGWQVEIPPRQWENYVQNKQDQAIAHFNQHGVPVWDASTEYQVNKSYVQGQTNGTIYQCILTHTNQDPEADLSNTYWIIAFAAAGDFYTKTETDNLYLAKANNLSDLTNTATARTNLSVYSQAQTYTKTEVDAKTTVASTAQSQAFLSNTVLLTPLRLDEALEGSNQSLTSNGYQKLPGGLIMQWGVAASATGTGNLVNFPLAFPNGVFVVIATDRADTSASVLDKTSIGTADFTSTGFRLIAEAVSSAYWFAVGY